VVEQVIRCPRCDAVVTGLRCTACDAPAPAGTDDPPPGQRSRRAAVALGVVAVAIASVAGFIALARGGSDGATGAPPTTTQISTTETTAQPEPRPTAPASVADGGAQGSVVDIAAGNPDLSTLVELVTATGLGETLSGVGPFTVFAPTNSAFAFLDPATVEALRADPQGALTEVLKLHVIPGRVDVAALSAAAGTCVEMLGGKVYLQQSGASLTVAGAPIVVADIAGSNGVIHVVDGLVTAPSEGC
jgi:uncharacterized surface protein with fasciclin (FAS1) repeats